MEPLDANLDNPNRRTLILSLIGLVAIGACALLYLAFLWNQSDGDSFFTEAFPSSTATRRPTLTPEPSLTSIPFPTATRGAWVKPAIPPTLASPEQASAAYLNGDAFLEVYASVYPELPDINQAGDVYAYELQLMESVPLVWLYGWCTTTQAILEENFRSIQLEFTLNETVVPLDTFAIVEITREDGSPCRDYVALIESWPAGEHRLESRINFTQPINDGWNLYPAGIHIYQYSVIVSP
jgi:hypothetical protein